MCPHPLLARLAVLLLTATLAGCGDDPKSTALRERLAEAQAEVEALRAGRAVVEKRLAATRAAARAAADRARRQEQERNAALASAAQWREAHGALAAQLAARENELLAAQVELAGAARGLMAAQERNAELARQLAGLNGWLGQQSAQSQSQGIALRRTEGDLEEQSRTAQELSRRVDGLREQLDAAGETAATLRASRQELEGVVRSAKAELQQGRQEARRRVSELQRERDALRTQLQDTAVRAAELATSNELLKERMADLRGSLAKANDRNDGLRRAREYLDDRLQSQDAEMAGLRGSQVKLRNERDEIVVALDARRRELLQAVTGCERANAAAGARVAALERDVGALQAQVAETQQRAEQAETGADELRRARGYLDGKLSALTEEIERERKEHEHDVVRLREALRLAVEEVRLLQASSYDSSAGLDDALLREAATRRTALLQQVDALRAEVLARNDREAIYRQTLDYLRALRVRQEEALRRCEGRPAG